MISVRRVGKGEPLEFEVVVHNGTVRAVTT